ncbi:MAG: sugar phosphate isomerase/epimerase [Proteobacteria bacterium]|nr:MAG: sugar phosphate isomerase/epimerase [Pseudomonadota bacterium]
MKKIVLSNIAWEPAQNSDVIPVMHRYGVNAVEVAPAKINPNPSLITEQMAKDYRSFWNDRGIEIVSMQALLFGAPPTAIFEGPELQKAMINHFSQIFKIAGILGARRLVFGSPKNRLKGKLEMAQALDIATPFFRKLGDMAVQHGTMLCIEPNPPYYGCDFVTTSSEALELVKLVGSPGFGLHLDSGGMSIVGEDICSALIATKDQIGHFHISEKDLAPLGNGSVNHEVFAQTLRAINYNGWLSIEMKCSADYLNDIESALALVTRTY